MRRRMLSRGEKSNGKQHAQNSWTGNGKPRELGAFALSGASVFVSSLSKEDISAKGRVFFVVVVCLILFFGFLLISTETRKTFLEVQNHYQMQKDKNCRILKLGKVKSWTKGDQCHWSQGTLTPLQGGTKQSWSPALGSYGEKKSWERFTW